MILPKPDDPVTGENDRFWNKQALEIRHQTLGEILVEKFDCLDVDRKSVRLTNNDCVVAQTVEEFFTKLVSRTCLPHFHLESSCQKSM